MFWKKVINKTEKCTKAGGAQNVSNFSNLTINYVKFNVGLFLVSAQKDLERKRGEDARWRLGMVRKTTR